MYEALIPICGGTIHFTLAQERSATTGVGRQHFALQTVQNRSSVRKPGGPWWCHTDRHTQKGTHEGVHNNDYNTHKFLQNISYFTNQSSQNRTVEDFKLVLQVQQLTTEWTTQLYNKRLTTTTARTSQKLQQLGRQHRAHWCHHLRQETTQRLLMRVHW